MTTRLDEYIATLPASAQGIVTRALRKQGARSNAIKAKCLDCCHFDRDEVRNCQVWRCPLHPWRPFQNTPKKHPSPKSDEPVPEAAT